MAIEIRPLTIAVRMRAVSMRRTAVRHWYEAAAVEYEVDKEEVFYFLNDFCLYSARIICNGKEKLPFELAKATDNPDELKRKFDLYMSANALEVDKLERLIDAADKPYDSDLVPDIEPTDPED